MGSKGGKSKGKKSEKSAKAGKSEKPAKLEKPEKLEKGKKAKLAVAGESKDPGAKALIALHDRLAAIDEADVQRANVDVDAALVAVTAIATFVNAPKTHARFASLPSGEFSLGAVDDLTPLIAATRYAHQRLRDAAAPVSEAKVPYHLVEVGTQIKARMMRLCEYHFEDDPKYGPIVADIRDGQGYLDLASDLDRLAQIYEDEYDLVDKDLRNYSATDHTDARSFAKQIRDALADSVSGEQAEWRDTLNRVWTLLLEAYTEVRETGLWLFRASIDRAEKFPSIFTAGRSGRPTKKKKKKGSKGAPQPPPPAPPAS